MFPFAFPSMFISIFGYNTLILFNSKSVNESNTFFLPELKSYLPFNPINWFELLNNNCSILIVES